MSYFVLCSFDLANASYSDYETAYADLARLGLRRQIPTSQGKPVTLPTTMVAGEFNGGSAGAIRDDLTERVSQAFLNRGFRSEIFVSVGGDWAWAHRTT